MVEILSSARTQSVKDIKRKSRIKKRNSLIIKWSLIIIIVFLLVFLIKNYILDNKHSYIDQTTGIVFYSKDFFVKDVFKILANDKNISLVFNISSQDINNLNLFTEHIVNLQSLFSANNSNPVLIITIMDSLLENRNILSCQTNFGDIYKNELISSQECNNLINNNSTLIIIDYPNINLEKTIVSSSVKDKFIYIKSKSNTDLLYAINLISNMMFNNVDDTKQKIDYYKNKLDKVDNSDFINNFDLNLAVEDINNVIYSDNNFD
ncbi:MAG: hypothetical protein PHR26_03035 [Candidatus ainarchaeum sp.]|nr:hypothetical protein [Candidatus ainarchaeum sp.]MDD3975985.1 hypothetical protein [Candidatus ainarchaeum sp.]